MLVYCAWNGETAVECDCGNLPAGGMVVGEGAPARWRLRRLEESDY